MISVCRSHAPVGSPARVPIRRSQVLSTGFVDVDRRTPLWGWPWTGPELGEGA